MKLPTHGVYRQTANTRSAFTLIEMIGVLAVIAILASMLIPRVFEAINSARVNATTVGCETVKTAAADHFGKYGKFDMINGTSPIPDASYVAGIYGGYDTNVLMVEGLLDKPFSAKIAGGDPNLLSVVQLVKSLGATGPFGGPSPAIGYALDGANSATTNAQFVLEAVIRQVSVADAKDLNDRIDGLSLGADPATGADTRGRVEYAKPTGGTVDVYVYLTHR